MKIQKTNQTFDGIKIASARAKLDGAVSDYDLYKITPKDNEFLAKLPMEINLSELWPGLESFEYFFWYKELNNMLRQDNARDVETILIAKDGIPCGGLNYSFDKNNCKVGYRVTWPVEKGKKAPFAGKILYLQLFKKCLKDAVSSIKTTVSLCGPFDTFTKCWDLGFKPFGGDDYNERMSISTERMLKACEKFKDNIEIIPVSENEQIDQDLDKVLKFTQC